MERDIRLFQELYYSRQASKVRGEKPVLVLQVPLEDQEGEWIDIAVDDADYSLSHNSENDTSSVKVNSNAAGFINTHPASGLINNEHDRLHVMPLSGVPTQRRESFLYRSDSDCDTGPPPRSSRHSSLSSEGVRTDELVTPFAQVMSALHNVRSNFVLLTNIRQNRQRRGSEGFHLNNRLCQLYEISDGNMIRDDMFKKLTMESLKEFDWCLDQLESLKASMSISEMASNKFKKLLDRELKDFSETGVGGPEISAWVFDTFVDKEMGVQPRKNSVPLRARSRSLVKSLRKLSRTVSCSGNVPRFGIEHPDEPAVEKVMESLNTWSFDVFKLQRLSGGRPLVATTYTIVQTRDLLKTFKIRPFIFVSYMSLVENHYLKDVPFHNSMHAADVTHATHVLLSASVFESVFTELEVLAAIVASAVHDVDHPGVNNQFLVNSSSEMALMYNDESVLENHHLAVAFQLLQHENCDILESFSRAERQLFRKMVIEMVLATDNAKHMNILGSLKTMVETKRISRGTTPLEINSFSEKMHILKCMVHCADLSNPTRKLSHYQKWVEELMEEFFRQGDLERERNMEISPMMDRDNANIEKSQVVFIDFVVHPLWETWADLVYPDAQEIMENLETNREYYKSQSSISPLTTPNSTPITKRKDTADTLKNSIKSDDSDSVSDLGSADIADTTKDITDNEIRRKSDSYLLSEKDRTMDIGSLIITNAHSPSSLDSNADELEVDIDTSSKNADGHSNNEESSTVDEASSPPNFTDNTVLKSDKYSRCFCDDKRRGSH